MAKSTDGESMTVQVNLLDLINGITRLTEKSEQFDKRQSETNTMLMQILAEVKAADGRLGIQAEQLRTMRAETDELHQLAKENRAWIDANRKLCDEVKQQGEQLTALRLSSVRWDVVTSILAALAGAGLSIAVHFLFGV